MNKNLKMNQNNNEFKIIIAFIITILTLGMFYLGAYLPLAKSQMYINAYRDLPKIKSLEEFNKIFEKVFDYYSPIGQEEIISGYLNILVNLISSQKLDEQVANVLFNNVDGVMNPFLKSGKGFNLSQNIYALATVYEIAANKFNSPEYRQRSIYLYQEGLKYSPGRPIFIFGLFNSYYNFGDKQKAKKIGEIILKSFKVEDKVKTIIENL
ncbi:hypothetical protein HZC33_02255 [Candidatus Wolfebacteria bacterium]|nr:hypothetical protein [Candidatus Wolfebacteria bacterium]